MREWVSFQDDDGDTWVFDLTFLTSNWRCIYGQGCLGILEEPAPELHHGCCTHGAHFTDADDLKRTTRAIRRLRPSDWQFHGVAKALGGAITVDEDGATVTRTHDGACVFNNRPGFEGGIGCALHAAALRAGERPLDWKPEVCWQVPLRLDHHVDDNGFGTYTLREWQRRDWGDGGDDFHWWCTEDNRAFVDERAVYVTMRDEIREMVGDDMYDQLARYVAARPKKPETFLPHPAKRVRPGRARSSS
jgi:hypothetical protein